MKTKQTTSHFALYALLLLLSSAACAPTASETTTSETTGNAIVVIDARGEKMEIKDTSHIVAIGGSITEVIYALGADRRLVGVDTSSVYPEAARALPQIGYMRQFSPEGVLSLKPSLVIATPDAGPPQGLEQLRAAGVSVLVVPSENSIAGAQNKILTVAQALNMTARGEELARNIEQRVGDTEAALAGLSGETKPRVLIVIARGQGSLSVSGAKTAADEMVRLAGGTNAVTGYEGYKPLTPEAAVSAAPDVILLPLRGLESIGGVEGALTLPGIGQTPAGKNRRIVALDDLLLLGFGVRTGEAVGELATLLNPRLRTERK